MRQKIKIEFQKHLHNSTKLSIFLPILMFPSSTCKYRSDFTDKVTKVGNGKIKEDFLFYNFLI